MKLRAVGFCGVDESVDPSLLALISLRYPAIEWGVLFRPDKAGEPRYPGAAWVDRLASHAAASAGGMALAGHLCGERAVEVIRNQSAFVERLEAKGFARVQLNPTAVNGVCLRAIGLDVDQAASGICACIDATPALEWILQYNDETRELCEAVLATLRRAGDPVRPASVLFDASCGTGVAAASYAPPLRDVPTGYAGGLGPANLGARARGRGGDARGAASRPAHLRSAARARAPVSPRRAGSVLAALRDGVARDASIWVDMESRLRANLDGVDVFDVNKAWACAAIAREMGLIEAALISEQADEAPAGRPAGSPEGGAAKRRRGD